MGLICPLCDAADDRIVLETHEIYGNDTGVARAFYHCGACDVFFQWPRLTDDEESKFYRLEFEKFMAGRNADGGFDWTGPEVHVRSNQEQRSRREKYLAPIYREISQRPEPALLEIGCSSGFMMYGLREVYGIDCYGVEPSGVFNDFLKGGPITAATSLDELARLHPEKRFDLVMHSFVLEHIKDPKPFIAASLDLVKPGGRLVFEVPNGSDALRTLYPTEAFKSFYWSIAHPWYFTEPSLSYLLTHQCGLANVQIVKDQRYDIGNHIRWLKDGRPGGQHALDHIFDEGFRAVFRDCLIRSGHCDTLVAIIAK